MLRVALGPCSCSGHDKSSGVAKVACGQLFEILERLKRLSYSQLSALPEVDTSTILVDGFELLMAVQASRGDDEILVVVQAFHPTWKFPNYISAKGIGRKFVEGFVLKKDGALMDAPDEQVWGYR